MSTTIPADELQNINYWPTEKSQGNYILLFEYKMYNYTIMALNHFNF